MPIEFGRPGPPPRPVIPTRPTAHGPRPGPGTGSGTLRRRDPLPLSLGPARDPDAIYLLDCGVGLAFGHVQRLDLLAKHYGEHLHYVEDVAIEWRRQSRSKPVLPPPGSDPELFADHARAKLVKKTARALLTQVPALFGDAVDLGLTAQPGIEALVQELRSLPPALTSGGARDRGECATVYYGTQLAPATRVVVICANDDRARRLAANHTIAHRNTHTVLREMVHDKHIDAQEAWRLYQAATAVTELPAWTRPSGPADFA